MNQEQRILLNAKNLVEKGWTKKAWARQANGRDVDVEYAKAERFSMAGAVLRVVTKARPKAQLLLWAKLITLIKSCLPHTPEGVCEYPTLADYNDHPKRTKEEVLAIYDKAIELAGKE